MLLVNSEKVERIEVTDRTNTKLSTTSLLNKAQQQALGPTLSRTAKRQFDSVIDELSQYPMKWIWYAPAQVLRSGVSRHGERPTQLTWLLVPMKRGQVDNSKSFDTTDTTEEPVFSMAHANDDIPSSTENNLLFQALG
ncbi:hypothetical protein CISG_01682 [Coccidioides immitis RMSCC 3703]|uniref:Uncharacterized protein n=1 Tax=Coccidioides immitis RMSCC 3703 TaxID=454286 RepID=A0A0J8TXF9_COCIT|nr:hypothetical protein CISG_01682 [Coccidioides immitis RMSCC 3703]